MKLNLIEVKKGKPFYFMIKNGEMKELMSPHDLIVEMLKMKENDYVLIRDAVGDICAPICIKFAGTDECLAGAFFGDICKSRNKKFQYMPFGYDRTSDPINREYVQTDFGKVGYYQNVSKLDNWFQKLWYDAVCEIQANEAK